MGGSKRTGSFGAAAFAELKAFKENGTDNNQAGYFAINTNSNASTLTEALRLDSSQNATFAGNISIADSLKTNFTTGGSMKWGNALSGLTASGGTEVIRVRIGAESVVGIIVTITSRMSTSSDPIISRWVFSAYVQSGAVVGSNANNVFEFGNNVTTLEGSIASEGANYGVDVTITNNHSSNLYNTNATVEAWSNAGITSITQP